MLALLATCARTNARFLLGSVCFGAPWLPLLRKVTQVDFTRQACHEINVWAFSPLYKGATCAHALALARGCAVDFGAVLAR